MDTIKKMPATCANELLAVEFIEAYPLGRLPMLPRIRAWAATALRYSVNGIRG